MVIVDIVASNGPLLVRQPTTRASERYGSRSVVHSMGDSK